MSSRAGPIAGRGVFVGREQEIADLKAAVENPSIRIVHIHGDRGAGKTTLASQLFYYYRDVPAIFDSAHYLSAHGTTEQMLLDELYRVVCVRAANSYHPADLPSLLGSAIESYSGDQLVFIDNVEDDVISGELFHACMLVLAGTKKHCVVVLTSRAAPPRLTAAEAARCEIQVQGIREPAAVLSLLGDALRHRHSVADLLRMADTIGRLPQRLLYCRWAQPEDVQAFAERFAEQQQPLSMEALRQVLGRLPDAGPLLACGVLRGTDIDRVLLAWLVRSLGAESTLSFEDRLGEWLGHRLLALVAGGNGAVRIHPDTHVDLLRLCEEKGVAWVRSCHQAAWAYYRERFAEEPENVSAAGEAVHHALALGEFDAAYVALFAQKSVERWRQQGLSVRIEPILEELRSVSRIAGLSATQEQRAGIDVARAHVASDLGRPRLCLEHLMAAQLDLDGIARTAEVERTLRGLWMQLAVSHANLGDTARCIECYHRVISSDALVMETQTALCMGYLGYEYCDFEDFASAHYWTRRALDDCPCERSPQVFSKNLSNRGIVLYFIGDLSAAAAHLRSAVDLVSNPASAAYDVREQGRALSHWAMIELSRGRPTVQVDSLLEESLRLTRQAGDERRIALTQGRIGIVAGVAGDFARSEELLHQAVVAHHRVGDLRNMIFELLALLSIRHRRLFGSYGSHLKDLERAAQGISADLAHLIHGSIARPDKTYLVDFWTHCQRPRVFADRPS